MILIAWLVVGLNEQVYLPPANWADICQSISAIRDGNIAAAWTRRIGIGVNVRLSRLPFFIYIYRNFFGHFCTGGLRQIQIFCRHSFLLNIVSIWQQIISLPVIISTGLSVIVHTSFQLFTQLVVLYYTVFVFLVQSLMHN